MPVASLTTFSASAADTSLNSNFWMMISCAFFAISSGVTPAIDGCQNAAPKMMSAARKDDFIPAVCPPARWTSNRLKAEAPRPRTRRGRVTLVTAALTATQRDAGTRSGRQRIRLSRAAALVEAQKLHECDEQHDVNEHH